MNYKIGDWIKLKAERGWKLTNCTIVGRNKGKYLIATPDSFGRYEVSASDIECKYER